MNDEKAEPKYTGGEIRLCILREGMRCDSDNSLITAKHIDELSSMKETFYIKDGPNGKELWTTITIPRRRKSR